MKLLVVSCLIAIVIRSSTIIETDAFSFRNLPVTQQQRATSFTNIFLSSAPSDVEDIGPNDDDYDDNTGSGVDGTDTTTTTTATISSSSEERSEIKSKLLQLCASYDRGFGASTKARNQVEELVEQLEGINPTPVDAARGIDGGDNNNDDDDDVNVPPLKGIWRMVWTTALDVLNLAASPVASQGAIYQVIEPPIATNIIDFIPRAQSLLPTTFPPTLLRAEVKTRTSSRPSQSSNRVGLDFEAVKVIPIEILGMKTDGVLPPLSVNLPRINVKDLPGVDPDNSPGYFDVTYLDDDMLIIKQNAPGGYFVSIKVDDCDP